VDVVSPPPSPADDEAPNGRPAAFFDLDKTIIARSSTLAFSRAFFEGGLITRRSALRSAYAQFVFGRSGIDHEQMDCVGTDVQHTEAHSVTLTHRLRCPL